MRVYRSRRLTILSEAEKLALYGLPDFDDFQRAEFLAMTNAERSLALRRNGLRPRFIACCRLVTSKPSKLSFASL